MSTDLALQIADAYLRHIDGDDFGDPEHGHDLADCASIVDKTLTKHRAQTSKKTQYMKWEDVTSYSRGDKERKPTCWRLDGQTLSVTVVFNHLHYPGQWVFHCHQVGFDTEHISGAHTLEEAQAKALQIVELRLCRMIDTVSLMRQVK